MKQDLFTRIEEATAPDFGMILSKSFDLFKKTWQDGLYHVLILVGIMIPFIFIIYIPMFMIIGTQEGYFDSGYLDNFEPKALWIILFGLFVLLLIIIIQAISLAVIAHFFKVCKKVDTGSVEEIGSYFMFLKAPYFQKTFLLSLATFGISIAALLLCYLPLFYVMVPLQLIGVIYAFNEDLSISDIVKASFKLGHQFWFMVFGLIIISSLIAQIGILLCFVGLFFTAFLVHLPIYFFYKDTVGFE